MKIIETSRLILCQVTTEDADFILRLLNTPGWLQFIGNKNISTLEDAKNYIVTRLIKSYKEFGFGLLLIKLKDKNVPIGICGLIKRETLEDVDIGFALLTEHEGKGYAFESASAILEYADKDLRLKRVVAITVKDNINSINLLQKLQLQFEKKILTPENEELMLYAINYK